MLSGCLQHHGSKYPYQSSSPGEWAASKGTGSTSLQLFSVEMKGVRIAALEFPILYYVLSNVMACGEISSFLIGSFKRLRKDNSEPP